MKHTDDHILDAEILIESSAMETDLDKLNSEINRMVINFNNQRMELLQARNALRDWRALAITLIAIWVLLALVAFAVLYFR